MYLSHSLCYTGGRCRVRAPDAAGMARAPFSLRPEAPAATVSRETHRGQAVREHAAAPPRCKRLAAPLGRDSEKSVHIDFTPQR